MKVVWQFSSCLKVHLINFVFRQGAISYDSGGPIGEQQSIESTSSNQSHLRRPRSLTHQSVGSQHGFSLFGSVDSEQSVPRTAPLATPEQDMSLISSIENLQSVDNSAVAHGHISRATLQQQQSLDGIGNDVFQMNNNVNENDNLQQSLQPDESQSNINSQPEHPISFNVEITPPQASCPNNNHRNVTLTASEVDGASCLPDVVPKINHRLLKHRPSLISAQMSSSLETDSSQADTPLFHYSGSNSSSNSTTAFPFNPPIVVERKDSSTSSGSGPNTPEAMEIRRLRHANRLAASSSLHRPYRESEPSFNLPRLPCLPERSTYPVELKNGERLPSSK